MHSLDIARRKIRVAICDDHPFFREGLKAVLAASADVRVLVEAEHGQQLIDLLRDQPVDVLVLDWSLPGRDGPDILRDLRSWGITVPALILSAHDEDHYALRAMRAGAAGYLSKGTDADALLEAVRAVAAGRRYITAALAEQLADEVVRPAAGSGPAELSDREYQILIEFAAGRGIKEIAGRLNLSPSTVGTYRMRVLSKLNLGNNADLVRYAIQNRLVE